VIANQTRYISRTILPEKVLSQKIYWINKLSGEIPETNFITDYVRPVISTDKNKHINFELSKDVSHYLKNFTNNSYLSIYVILLAVFNTLMSKYFDKNSIIVGSPIHQQQDSDTLVNKIIPLRSYVNKTLNFTDLILQIKETVIDAYSHPHYDLEYILKVFNFPQSQNRHPIFDIVILLENIHNCDYLNNLQNDLTFSFLVTENVIQGKVEYKDLLFRDESISLIIDSYIKILTNICQNPHKKISDISCLTAASQHQLLAEFNDNLQDFPVEKSIHQLFEEQVKRTPSRTAVVCEHDKLTYQQLNEKANQLARLLCHSGVKPGEFIGIIKQRDLNFLIAILAILKVGGVYIPIDSTYPPDRIRYMISNSQVKSVLIDSSCQVTDLLSDLSQLKHIIFLDIQPEKSALQKIVNTQISDQIDFTNLLSENLDNNIRGFDPAYMIYTSGSTGLPKGAIIRHGGAINHIYAQFYALELTENLTFLQSAPASSDISVWQFIAPLLIGGKTVIVDTETVCNPQNLFEIIQSKNITIIELVPVVLTGLLNYICELSADTRLFPHLKWMMVTGESVSVELVNKWLQLYPAIKVVNAYGPTEAADDITQFIIDHPLPENLSTVPIGKPLANLNLYILDSQMQLLPIGVPGEICVSGFGVGLGYWQNEASTKSSFIPNPFVSYAKPLPGTNTDFIYKTGDLGRWLPDGNIEFLGRIDHQVKIRGFRVEVGEIEALLCQHSTVRETVVVVKEDSPGDKYLVAYIVPALASQVFTADLDSEQNIQDSAIIRELVTELRNFLKEKLPEYMVPSAFVCLKALPLSPSGKVDRRALPAPKTSKTALKGSFASPRTPTEEVVVDIWTQILGRERIGIHDNFFDLGGHSLLAIQVISRLRKAFQVELPLRSLFEEATIAKLVERIERIRTAQKLQVPPMAIADNREEIEL